MYNSSTGLKRVAASRFRESRKSTLIFAACFGAAIVIAPFVLGRSAIFGIAFLVASLIITLLWQKAPRPWIALASISASTPMAIGKQQFTCNLIFAIWFAIFNLRYLFSLPKWIYMPSVLVLLGIITSSFNWISGDFIASVMRQGAYALNFFYGPFLLLPIAYLRMRYSNDSEANLKGLLFFLIVPMTLVLFSAKLFGSIANWWEASQHVATLPEGFLQYKLGRVVINFTRTQIGFVLAALVCASTAVSVSHVKSKYRFVAIACLAMNVFMLLSTGSFGSAFACFLGLVAILHTQLRKISIAKAVISFMAILLTMILTYAFAPDSTKEYLGKRYEHRVVNANTDRIALWARGVDAFVNEPGGVGLTLSVGVVKKSYIHNDYLTYFVSYGFFGGLGYMSLIIGLLLAFLRVQHSVSKDPAALAVHLAGFGVIVALAANGITDHSNENRIYLNVIWSIIWYCYFCSRPVLARVRTTISDVKDRADAKTEADGGVREIHR